MAFWDEDKRAKRAQKKLDTAPLYSLIAGVMFAIVFFLLLNEGSPNSSTGRHILSLVFYAVLALGMLAYGFIKLANRERRISELDCETKKSGVVAVYTDIDEPQPGEDEKAENTEKKEDKDELLTSGK